jgi:predicted small metal-binding protein
MKVRCQEDLKIEGCDVVAQGETAGEVLREIVPHLRKEHNLDLPDVEEILAGKMSQDELFEGQEDEAVRLIVSRLHEALDIEPMDTPEGPAPARPSVPN